MPTDAPAPRDDDAVLVVFSTFPSSEKALEAAEALVSEGLAACVSVLPAVRSVYEWKGVVQRDDEVLAMLKTTAPRFAALRARLLALHPYELPEVLALPVADAHEPYLAWVRAQVRRPRA